MVERERGTETRKDNDDLHPENRVRSHKDPPDLS